MGTRERKQKEFSLREALFLEAAEAMVSEEGFLHLQMARLAEACDYATGTLYQHFSSKEDLLLALANRRMEAFVDIFRKVGAWQGGTPRERMFAIAVGDLDFSRHHPEHAKLTQYVHAEAVWENTSPERREQAMCCTGPVGEVVAGIVQEAIDRGDLDAQGLSPLELACGPWSVCEGMRALSHVQGLFESLNIRSPERLFFRQVQVHLNGLNWAPLADPADHAATDALVARVRREVFDVSGPDAREVRS
ncbi:TetR family transcriptional regulator [Thioalkalivibrio denitrificans]|uniref:TetR family transcriptional regulator n=1 Tax=Thioalkalivibrio denitrificans TaxID=108003 RepID=A0A1V3NFI1_9GAMM|nr:TetR/AcrR family transcriptional regulator [Thioalkalivibrio denitrificans]OOG23612.1 TetR family transcriptional regulator [Thioalkalivibrio denitrificans]